MNIFECIDKRKSTRKFSDKEIPQYFLNRICEYAYKIPSAGNLRPIELCYFKDIDNKYYIIICADFKKTTSKYGERGMQYVYMEAGHTAQNICLICEELELGSCCIGAFDNKKIKKTYKLEFEPIYIVAIGYKCE